MKPKTIADMHLGDTSRFGKTIAESDIYLYAGRAITSPMIVKAHD